MRQGKEVMKKKGEEMGRGENGKEGQWRGEWMEGFVLPGEQPKNANLINSYILWASVPTSSLPPITRFCTNG